MIGSYRVKRDAVSGGKALEEVYAAAAESFYKTFGFSGQALKERRAAAKAGQPYSSLRKADLKRFASFGGFDQGAGRTDVLGSSYGQPDMVTAGDISFDKGGLHFRLDRGDSVKRIEICSAAGQRHVLAHDGKAEYFGLSREQALKKFGEPEERGDGKKDVLAFPFRSARGGGSVEFHCPSDERTCTRMSVVWNTVKVTTAGYVDIRQFLSFAGLARGAKAEDVKAVYGRPSVENEYYLEYGLNELYFWLNKGVVERVEIDGPEGLAKVLPFDEKAENKRENRDSALLFLVVRVDEEIGRCPWYLLWYLYYIRAFRVWGLGPIRRRSFGPLMRVTGS